MQRIVKIPKDISEIDRGEIDVRRLDIPVTKVGLTTVIQLH